MFRRTDSVFSLSYTMGSIKELPMNNDPTKVNPNDDACKVKRPTLKLVKGTDLKVVGGKQLDMARERLHLSYLHGVVNDRADLSKTDTSKYV